jgi:hypothetical protein
MNDLSAYFEVSQPFQSFLGKVLAVQIEQNCLQTASLSNSSSKLRYPLKYQPFEFWGFDIRIIEDSAVQQCDVASLGASRRFGKNMSPSPSSSCVQRSAKSFKFQTFETGRHISEDRIHTLSAVSLGGSGSIPEWSVCDSWWSQYHPTMPLFHSVPLTPYDLSSWQCRQITH